MRLVSSYFNKKKRGKIHPDSNKNVLQMATETCSMRNIKKLLRNSKVGAVYENIASFFIAFMEDTFPNEEVS